MKYIKKFEQDKIAKYDDGDYIKLNGPEDIYLFSKILTHFCKPGSVTYKIEKIQQDQSNNFLGSWIDEDDIERPLTPEEIQDYEIRKSQTIFNL